jgi:hypothetical protein
MEFWDPPSECPHIFGMIVLMGLSSINYPRTLLAHLKRSLRHHWTSLSGDSDAVSSPHAVAFSFYHPVSAKQRGQVVCQCCDDGMIEWAEVLTQARGRNADCHSPVRRPGSQRIGKRIRTECNSRVGSCYRPGHFNTLINRHNRPIDLHAASFPSKRFFGAFSRRGEALLLNGCPMRNLILSRRPLGRIP